LTDEILPKEKAGRSRRSKKGTRGEFLRFRRIGSFVQAPTDMKGGTSVFNFKKIYKFSRYKLGETRKEPKRRFEYDVCKMHLSGGRDGNVTVHELLPVIWGKRSRRSGVAVQCGLKPADRHV